MVFSHQAFLSECRTHFPELLPGASWCYSQHPILWHPLGCLRLEQGVQHGDPIDPLLFLLVLNISSWCQKLPPMKLVQTCHMMPAWYWGNGVLAGVVFRVPLSNHKRSSGPNLVILGIPGLLVTSHSALSSF